MPTKAFILKKFLEIIGHSHQIKFDDTLEQMNSCRMNIPKNQTFLVNMVYTTTKLPKDRDGLIQAKVSFTK